LIDVDPILGRAFPAPAFGNAIVVDENVDLTDCLRDIACAVVGSNVACDRVGIVALFANRPRDLFGGLDFESMDPDRRTFARKDTREARACAAIAARDECSFACEF